ncbi:bridge-like lipid transfer protein family member 3B [Watersipora subatra]|uniref:bridge-like lipid transfer protein family member 3B n=1 Tax=Watersipora subatra TaxID=2589382 RepID=UPI00355B8F1C
MAAIIKTQIVKHLSKFTKNLSPDKIQLSTLKGEGELTNLELDEAILMELMDLPTWVRLTKATCNKVNIRMQWSKLKSQPIELYLDEVLVSMEMCEELREPTNISGLPSYSSGGRYGFGDKVVDGMYLHINAVIVSFSSKAFQASINLSRIIIQSKTPKWRVPNELSHTRICDKQNDFVLTFKEVSWQTLKVEADCMVSEGDRQTTPLRLITNESKIRISAKKRYSDCSPVATRLHFIMDDLLWIVTDSQVKAAVVFAKHIKDNIDKSHEQSKKLAAQQLQKQRQLPKKSAVNQGGSQRASPILQSKNQYDITESSYHVQTCRVDLHICDDINDERRKRLVDGGAIGLAIMKLQVSHYPMRPAGESRASWAKCDDNTMARDEWTAALLKNYANQSKLDAAKNSHKKTHLTPEDTCKSLVERLTILAVEDFFITTVSQEHQETTRPTKLIMSDKKSLHLPADMSAIHAEFTEYFHGHTTSLPTPCPNAYIRVNPIKLVVDTYTITWFNSFALSLAKDVDELLKALPIDTNKKKERMELRLEALMPKIVLPVMDRIPQYQHGRPDSLQILISKLLITNNHTTLNSNKTTKAAHTNLLNKCSKLFLSNTKEFPNDSSRDLDLIAQEHRDYAADSRLSHMLQPHEVTETPEPFEMLSVELEQLWAEFTGVKNAGSRPVSFIESFPVTVWLATPIPSPAGPASVSAKEPSNHLPLQRLSQLPKAKVVENGHSVEDPTRHMGVMVNVESKICVQLNHYQFCFLMRLADTFTEMLDMMSEEVSLHKDLFTKGPGETEVIAVLDSTSEDQTVPMAVILELREVQLALLAKPGANVNSNMESFPSSTEHLPPITSDALSSSALLPITQNEAAETEVAISVDSPTGTMSEDISPSCSDSGIASVSTVSFYEEADAHLRKGHVRSPYHTIDSFHYPTDHNAAGKLSSMLVKVTSKVKSSINKVKEDADHLDVMSISSGISDDFDLLAELSGQEEEAAFVSKQNRGLNDDQSSTISTGLTERPKQMFSVMIFRLCGIEVGIETVEKDIVAKVALRSLTSEDKGNVYYDDFQAQQISDMNCYMPESKEEYPIRVRFCQGPAAADLATGASDLGFAHIKVSDYKLSFLSSTIDKLGPLFKDEKVNKSMPLLIEVANFDLELKDDSPPAYLTESPSVPICLHVHKVSLLRSIDGIFTVQGDTLLGGSSTALKVRTVSQSSKSTDMTGMEKVAPKDRQCVQRAGSSAQLLEEMRYLQDENKALKEQILRLNEKLIEKDHAEFERGERSDIQANFELHKDLEFYKKETKNLRSKVVSDGYTIDGLQSAKECLLETIQLLKEELDRSQQSAGKRSS